MLRIRVPLFNLKHTLQCGQVFGWKKIGDWYQGIFRKHIILITQEKNNLIYDSPVCRTGREVDCRDFLIRTFRLDDDLEDIYSNISKDAFMKAAIEYGRGLRIMRQEPFKCLISYICSATSSILNIGRMLDNLSRELGLPLRFKNYNAYSFPSPKALAKTSLKELNCCKLGFRARYVQEASKLISTGKFSFQELRALNYKEIKQRLLTLSGVGEKIADCVALFSLDKLEAFPVDVWIRRAMTKYYFNGKKVSDKKIRQFAHSYWGEYAGYAQEYIYYYVRSNPGLIA